MRWLDVNPQGGNLDAISTYIVVPVFNVPVNDGGFGWLGYSDVVGQFNFESPNNLSLKLTYTAPTAPNYSLAVKYVNADHSVVRYWLWRSAQDVVYDTFPMYAGQLVKKNFTLEVWSTNVDAVFQTTPVTIYTSVKGGYDYRFQNDMALVTADSICESQSADAFVVQSPTNTGGSQWLSSNAGITLDGSNNVNIWNNLFTHSGGVNQLTAGNRPAYPAAPGGANPLLNGNMVALAPGKSLSGSTGAPAYAMYALVQVPAGGGLGGQMFVLGAATLGQTPQGNVQLTIGANNIISSIPNVTAGWTGTIEVYRDAANANTLINIWDQRGVIVWSGEVPGTPGGGTGITVGGGATFSLFQALAFTTPFTANMEYTSVAFTTQLPTWSLPLVWGFPSPGSTCAQPVLNVGNGNTYMPITNVHLANQTQPVALQVSDGSFLFI